MTRNLLDEARLLIKMGFQALLPALLLGLWAAWQRRPPWAEARLTPRGLHLAGAMLILASPLAGLLLFYISNRCSAGLLSLSLQPAPAGGF